MRFILVLNTVLLSSTLTYALGKGPWVILPAATPEFDSQSCMTTVPGGGDVIYDRPSITDCVDWIFTPDEVQTAFGSFKFVDTEDYLACQGLACETQEKPFLFRPIHIADNKYKLRRYYSHETIQFEPQTETMIEAEEGKYSEEWIFLTAEQW